MQDRLNYMKLENFYKNKVVLITGASMGIGKELAIQVLQLGGKVIITGRNENRLLKIKNELNQYSDRLMIHKGDVADYSDKHLLIESIVNRFGKLDVLINNAGMSTSFCDLETIGNNVVDEIIDTNIKGSVYTTIAALPELRKTKGSVIFNSSLTGLFGMPGYSLYSLTKMSLTALAQSISIENKNYGVFIGISYIGFTENDNDKKTLTKEGKLTQVPKRDPKMTCSRSETAKIILNQIIKRKKTVVHSTMGKLLYFLSNKIPLLAGIIYEQIYIKQKKNITLDECLYD